MITRNIDVKKKKANGTQCNFKGLILKIGATYQREKINGVWVNTVYASDVDSVICTLMGTNTKIELKAEERTSDVGIPYNRPDTQVYQKKINFLLSCSPQYCYNRSQIARSNS